MSEEKQNSKLKKKKQKTGKSCHVHHLQILDIDYSHKKIIPKFSYIN